MATKRSYRGSVFSVTFNETVSVVEFVKSENEVEMEQKLTADQLDYIRFKHQIAKFETKFERVFKAWKLRLEK